MVQKTHYPAEVWDLRLGPIIWEKFLESYPENLLNSDDYGRIKNYLYYNIVSLEPEPFIALAKEILSGSLRGKEMIAKIVDDIKKQLKDEDYEDATGETNEPDRLRNRIRRTHSINRIRYGHHSR